jgi:hypothetical protein
MTSAFYRNMSTMKTLTQEVPGRDLPEKWRIMAEVSPDEYVTVIIQPSRDKLTGKLLEIAERASGEARKKGLTEERLSELLNEKE